MKVNKRLFFIAGLIIILILMTACNSRQENSLKKSEESENSKNEAVIVPQNGGYIVFAITRDAIILNPLLMNDFSSMRIASNIFEGLVKYDENLNLVGVLAESWEILDQGMEIIFHLKKNVKWHDGNIFTAYDVKYTYDTIMSFKGFKDENGNFSQLYTYFEYVKSVNVLDDYTIKVSYSTPYSGTISIWQISVLPKHILEKYTTPKDIVFSEFNRKPVGTGPFKFSKWIPDERIILESNRDYHSQTAYIDKLIYSVNPEQEIIYLDTLLEKNDVAELTPTQFGRLKEEKKNSKNISALKYTGNHYMFLGFNNKHPKFENPEVRKAIFYGINRKDIIKGVLEGFGEVCNGPFLPFSWAFNKDYAKENINNGLEYSPDKSRKILQNLGWQDLNNDGILEKNGKDFEIEVVVDRSKPARNMALKFIKRNLADIGIRLNIVPLSWNILLNDYIFPKKFEATIIGWELDNDPDIYNIWHTEGPLNFFSYSNAEVDRLLERGRKTFDLNIRKECYRKVHSIIMEEMPYAFLYIDNILVSVNNRIHGVKVKNSGLNEKNNWFVKYRTVIY